MPATATRAWIRREVAELMAATRAGRGAVPGRAGGRCPARRRRTSWSARAGGGGRLKAALAVIEAEDAAAAAEAERRAEAAAADAERGRLRSGRKPTEPLAALARAQIDQQVALARAAEMQAAAQAKREASRAARSAPRRRRAASDAAKTARWRARRPRLPRAGRRREPRRAPARQANVTDPDSRIMKTTDGWVQGYNAQAIVNQRQIVLACDVSQHTGDVELYEPMIDQARRRRSRAAGIAADTELALADAGYWSEANAAAPGPDRLIATLKDHKQRRAARELGTTTGPPPPDATPLQEMEHLLRTPQGAAAYAQRSCLIEPIFGDRKHNRGDPRLPPPRPHSRPKRMGVHAPRRQPAQAPPAPTAAATA